MPEKIVFNYFCKGLIEIPSGNEICPRCEGKGYSDDLDLDTECKKETENILFESARPIYNEEIDPYECWVCSGNGFVDWVKFPIAQSWRDNELYEGF